MKKSKTVTIRLSQELYDNLRDQARALSQSPGGFAKESLIKKLAEVALEKRGVADLGAQVKILRAELALASEAILTAVGSRESIPHPEVKKWVRENLNR